MKTVVDATPGNSQNSLTPETLQRQVDRSGSIEEAALALNIPKSEFRELCRQHDVRATRATGLREAGCRASDPGATDERAASTRGEMQACVSCTKPPDTGVDVLGDLGRLGELVLEAAKFGLGLVLHPPGYERGCECSACLKQAAAWHVVVMGIVEGENLASGQTLSEAAEFSFVPLRAYIEAESCFGYLPVDAELAMPERLDLGRLGELVQKADELSFGLMISGPCETYGADGWSVSVCRDGNGWLTDADTLAEAAERTLASFQTLPGGDPI